MTSLFLFVDVALITSSELQLNPCLANVLPSTVYKPRSTLWSPASECEADLNNNQLTSSL